MELSQFSDLDEDLNLFEEDDWNFLSVDATAYNSEYYNDIYDKDFKTTPVYKVVLATICVSLLVCGFGFSAYTFFKPYVRSQLYTKEYESTKTLLTSEDALLSAERVVGGVQASSKEYVKVSKVVSGYFQVLSSGKNLAELNSYCEDTSTFANKYNDLVKSMEYAFDNSDCNARLLAKFGSYCSLNKINTVIKKDGVYYCYLNLSVPSSDDMVEYVYSHQYDFTKHFMAGDLDAGSVTRYFLDVVSSSAIPRKAEEFCIELKEDKLGDLYISDDSVIYVRCVSAYGSAMNTIYTILGSALTTTF